MLSNDPLAQWDRDSFFHPSTHLAQHARGETPTRIISKADGVFIEDRDGTRLLDAFAGLYCVNVGYGRTEIAEAIADQARELAYYHAYVGHGTEASITLAKMIMDRAPAHMSKVYFGLSGSDANETNIKLIWYYNNILGRPEKKKIISRWRGYHGSGLMTGSLTGLDLFHKKFDLPLAQVVHTESPYFYRRTDPTQSEEAFTAQCAAELEALIAREGADTIAAFIGEPVMGTGGIVPPPKGYWAAIQAVLRKHDILLVADEVVTGFGRLGTMFGSQHYGIEPDFITIAKGLTSAYAPLSGSIVSDRVWKVLEQGTDENGPIGHGWTYSAHPICAAAGVANLRLIDDLGLVAQCRPRRRLPERRHARCAGRSPQCRRGARRGAACARSNWSKTARRAATSTRRRRSAPKSPPPCSNAASSPAPCRKATSSASRRPSASLKLRSTRWLTRLGRQ